jgi:hypothetical protein
LGKGTMTKKQFVKKVIKAYDQVWSQGAEIVDFQIVCKMRDPINVDASKKLIMIEDGNKNDKS